ncbi:MAG: hypothetical protein HQL53_13485 [Magnetococcales bacterium]|nr:hypothetical protein [Magnetococcales bacterium]
MKPFQKILVVDDAPTNIKVLVEVLKSDYEIIVATPHTTADRAPVPCP